MTSQNKNQNNSFDQLSQEQKKCKKIKNQASEAYLKKWSVPENILYGRYIKTHMGQMSNKKKKKCGKFVKMSNFIGSKTENQCRSHHQKMLITFKSLQNIIRYVGYVKRRGDLISLQQYESLSGLNLSEQLDNKEQGKMEEQLSTQRQSQQEIKNEAKKQKDHEKDGQQWEGLPIVEDESKFVKNQDEGIFDVLDVQIYSDFFLC